MHVLKRWISDTQNQGRLLNSPRYLRMEDPAELSSKSRDDGGTGVEAAAPAQTVLGGF